MPASDAWQDLELRGAVPGDFFGHPAVPSLPDPVGAFAALVRRARSTRIEADGSPAPFGDRLGDHSAVHHVQGLARVFTSSGEPGMAISRSFLGKGVVLFTREAGRQLDYVRHVRTDLDHPGGMQAYGSLLAVALEAAVGSGIGRVDLYDDPLGAPVAGPIDQLVLDGSHGEPLEGRRAKAGWVAMTRLVGGKYLLLIGGQNFGRDLGWFFTWDEAAPAGKRFRFLTAYATVGARAHIEGGFGITHNAAFLSRDDGRLFLFALGTRSANGGIARIRLFELCQGTTPPSISLVRRDQRELKPAEGMTFRAGATVHVDQRGELALWVSARNAGLLTRRLRIARYG